MLERFWPITRPAAVQAPQMLNMKAQTLYNGQLLPL
jgi:hypothetical protein